MNNHTGSTSAATFLFYGCIARRHLIWQSTYWLPVWANRGFRCCAGVSVPLRKATFNLVITGAMPPIQSASGGRCPDQPTWHVVMAIVLGGQFDAVHRETVVPGENLPIGEQKPFPGGDVIRGVDIPLTNQCKRRNARSCWPWSCVTIQNIDSRDTATVTDHVQISERPTMQFRIDLFVVTTFPLRSRLIGRLRCSEHGPIRDRQS